MYLEALMKKFVSAIALSAVILSVISLSACGDEQNSEASVEENIPASSVVSEEVQESSQKSEQKSQAPKSAISASQISQMKSYLSSYQKMPQFNSKGTEIDARAIAQNKTVTLICDNINLTYTKLVVEQFKVAAEAVKFAKTVVAKTDGTDESINKALNAAVNDKLRRVGALALYFQVFAGRRLKRLLLINAYLPRRFHHRELHLRDVENLLTAQALHQVVHRKAQVFEHLLVDLSVGNNYLCTAADSLAKRSEPQRQVRKYHVKAYQRENWDYAHKHRHADVFNRQRRNV